MSENINALLSIDLGFMEVASAIEGALFALTELSDIPVDVSKTSFGARFIEHIAQPLNSPFRAVAIANIEMRTVFESGPLDVEKMKSILIIFRLPNEPFGLHLDYTREEFIDKVRRFYAEQ